VENSGTRYFEWFDPETGIRHKFRSTFEEYQANVDRIKQEAKATKRAPSTSPYKRRKFKDSFRDRVDQSP
jgi:hypothetical protein